MSFASKTKWKLYLFILHLSLPSTESVNEIAGQKLCQLKSGLPSIILDMKESLEDQVNQTTMPRELEIVGDLSKIELSLSYNEGSRNYFRLEGKELRLNEPLDRDAEDISSIIFQVLCKVRDTMEKRTFPVIIRISDLNDNYPKFSSNSYTIDVLESTPVGSRIFEEISAIDLDGGVNGLLQFSIPEAAEEKNGWLSLISTHNPIVTLNQSLDYEKYPKIEATILASDRAFNPQERKTSTATLTINVLDSDDQGPIFIQTQCTEDQEKCTFPEYNATVIRGVLSGIVDVEPEPIHAVDRDTLNYPIFYSFLSGFPVSFFDYFQIDGNSGVVRQLRAIEEPTLPEFNVIVKATEVSAAKRFSTGRLRIHVVAEDRNRPILTPSSFFGHVLENSAPGTPVLSPSNQTITFEIKDKDLGPLDAVPKYKFELTSNAFRVNEAGILVVGEGNLDRDPPNQPQLEFQIVVREVGFSFSSSSPTLLTVQLDDANDNSPSISPFAPIMIPARDGKAFITKVESSDKDSGLNAYITYSIYHVSNDGNNKFEIHPETGELYSVGKLKGGDDYSITIQATDGGGLWSRSILELSIVDGINAHPPLFSQFTYDVSVSEGASVGSEVIRMDASDPEGKKILYSLVGGNELSHFRIDPNTGVVKVNEALDREDLSKYKILVKAEDEGGLYSIAQINLKVLDADDNNPILLGTPYEFTAPEGVSNYYIGKVSGNDLDEGENGVVTFHVPSESPIKVNESTGELRTRIALDYEKERTHYVVLTGKGIGKESRIATATVTLHVEDRPDEAPVFKQFTYEVFVEENSPNSKIVQVEAIDPDTVEKSVTYVIKDGPYDKFYIDAVDGTVFSAGPLDYEEKNQHILIVGTEENTSGNLGSTATVIIHLIDRNDIPPVFSVIPRPIRLEDTTPVGFVLTTLHATDSDGTSPGNKVKYELIGKDKSYRYFAVHPDTGVLSLKNNLQQEMETEYQLDVRAYDLGEPPLDQVATLHVYVDHVATFPPDIRLGFAHTEYTAEIRENAPVGSKITELVILNKRNDQAPIHCRIRSEPTNLFEVNTTDNSNCIVFLAGSGLDYERKKEYELKIQLISLPKLISTERSFTFVRIKVQDENDNKPQFLLRKHRHKPISENKIYGGINRDAPIGTIVTRIQATDSDSGLSGKVSYELNSENAASSSFFGIEKSSGIVTSVRTLDSVVFSLLPFRFSVIASDGIMFGVKHYTQIPFVINVIEPVHCITLLLEGINPEEAKVKETDLIEALEESTGFIIGIQRIGHYKSISENGTLHQRNPFHTSVWFYAVDPLSDAVLETQHEKVAKRILTDEAQTNISQSISSKLSLRLKEIKTVGTAPRILPAGLGGLESEQKWSSFPITLVGLASLILLLGLIGIAFVCYKWSKYTSYRNQMERLVPSTQYEPFYIETKQSPSLKQYETQVLEMRLNADEGESCSDPGMEICKSRRTRSMTGHSQAKLLTFSSQRSPIEEHNLFPDT